MNRQGLSCRRRPSATRRATCAGVYLGLSLGGAILVSCGPTNVVALPGGEVGRMEAPISQELMGRAELATRRYNDPAIAMASWTVPTIWGCTGTMIGPNILMTAAHCGHWDRTVTFRTYRNSHAYVQSPHVMSGNQASDSEDFICRFMINSFHRSDLALYFCDPNAAGQSPGDKYGYLDFDVTQPQIGQQVYSIVAHPIDQLNIGDARLWTRGTVQSTSQVIWPRPPAGSPNGRGPISDPIGVGMDIFGEGGVSGSATLNPLNNKILVGPTSTVSPSWWKNALSMHDYLREATFEGTFDDNGVYHTGFDAANLTALGLVGANYVGAVDDDANFLFDIQEDLERLRGENARDWYDLDFESARRRALWETPEGFNVVDGGAHVIALPGSPYVVMRHRGLNLEPNTTYRISLRVRTISSNHPQSLELQLVREVAGNLIVDASESVATLPGAGWITTAVRMRSEGPETQLVVACPQPLLNAFVDSLTIVEEGAVMDFDSHDKRAGWRDGNTGARGRLVPDGRTTGTPNWAGFVYRDYNRPGHDDWSLSNARLALAPGAALPYRICFDTKQNMPSPAGPTEWGVMRVLNDGSEVVRKEFAPVTGWQTVCTDSFRVGSGEGVVMFGNLAEPWPHLVSSYLVDNVRVEYAHVFEPRPIRPRPIRPLSAEPLGSIFGN
jgi:hypothetical protein